MTDFGSDPYGVFPDTVQNLADGTVNALYTQQVDVKVPADGSFAGFPFIIVDSAEVISIEGLPPGISYQCNENASSECMYLPDAVGCFILSGIPTSEGDYDLIINLRVYTAIIPYDLPFSGYHITIDGSVGIYDAPNLSFKLSAPQPNPADANTAIFISTKKTGEGLFRLYDLVGREVLTRTIRLSQGKNKLEFDTARLPEGVYIYRVDAFQSVVTSRLLIVH